MKKSNFTAIILGTISGMLFALGMCMALIPQWQAFKQGVVFGVLGIVLFCMSIPYISNNTSVGLFFMGTGMVMASAAVLLFVPVMNLVFYIFKLTVKSLILLFNKLIGRKAVKV